MAYTIDKATDRCQSCRRPRLSVDGNYTETTPTVFDVTISKMIIHICADCASQIADDLKAQEKALERKP